MNMDQRVPRMVKGNRKSYRGKRMKNDSLKVVYISSPMKVKTSATRFRSLVQQLTGKNSDIAQYMDGNKSNEVYEIDCDDQFLAKETIDPYQMYNNNSSVSRDDTPTSSDSFPEPMNNVFSSHIIMKEEFQGIFSSSSFYDPSELDVLGSFDELL